MPKYMFSSSYTAEGVRALTAKGGTVRRTAIQSAVKSLGGKLEAFYFAFGSEDVVVLAELPGNESAAALAMAVSSSGAATVTTTVLLTPAEVDAAAQQAVAYRPPGA